MKPIQRNEVLGIAEYEPIRERFRARVIEEKKRRRVALGPKASCVFENRDTVLLQIQEMLRTERITREAAVQHEIDTYNELVPQDDEVSITLMIEIPDTAERDDFLAKAAGLERHISLVVGGDRLPALWDKTRELEGRTSAVHYLKFKLTPRARASLRHSSNPKPPTARPSTNSSPSRP